MDKMEIYDKYRSAPKEAKTIISGGRLKGMTDINPMWRIKALTETFGPCGIGWYYEVTKQWLEAAGDEISAFCNINLYIKDGAEWSKPIFGTGGNGFYTKEKNGLKMSDECYKMALTDAISVACKSLGIGADVYWDEAETKYGKWKDNPDNIGQTKAEPKEKKAANPITDQMAQMIYSELKRTGIGLNGFLKNYGINKVENLSKDQYDDAIRKLSSKPTKSSDEEPPFK